MRSAALTSMMLVATALSACDNVPACITSADCPTGATCTDGRCQAIADMGCTSTGEDDTCDGLDDDCDGTADEAWQGQQRCGLGPCAASAAPAVCTDGVETPCMPGMPTVEICNVADDDCDGVADETFDLSQSVAHCGACDSACDPPNAIPFCREGTCAMVACEVGFADCDGAPDNGCETEGACPPDGTCDGIDDDHDGRLDEDFARDGECGVGFCRVQAMVSSCVNGVFTACAPGAPTADDRNCNGLDEDCDGTSDEDYTTVERCGIGACATTAMPSTCAAGVEVACAPGEPSDETCNDIDDDCDGTVDNGFDLLADRENCGRCGAVCAPAGAEGACVDGTCRLARCQGGFSDCNGDPFDGCEVEGPCPAEADCDGVDDDGDGRVDEGFVAVRRCGEGVCAAIATPSTCRDGQLVPCAPGQPVSARDALCNGVDDDCDGAVDEDYMPDADCGVGACADGAAASSCAGGVETPCAPGEPVAEVCNGRDDDCDDGADEGLGLDAPCVAGEGLCARAGRTVCDPRGGVVCGAEPGVGLADDRQCDGLDTDCDGATDEDFVAPAGAVCEGARGACAAASAISCVDGAEVCTPGLPGDELCNALDDDCDGRHDEQGAEWAAPVEVPFAGQIVGEPRRALYSRMAWTGEHLGVVWTELAPDRLGERDSIGGFTVLDAAGNPLDPGITRPLTDAFITSPRIAWEGERFLTSWTDLGDNLIKYRRVHSDPRRSEAVVPLYGGIDGNLRAAESGSRGPLLGWYSLNAGQHDVVIGEARPDGPSRGHRLTDNPSNDRTPRLVAANGGFGVSWIRTEAGGIHSLWFRVLEASGRPISPEVLVGRIGPLAPAHDEARASAYHDTIWTGRHFAVGWVEEADGVFTIRTRLVSPDGELAGATVSHERPGGILSRDVPMRWIPELQSIAIAWSETVDGRGRVHIGLLDPADGHMQRVEVAPATAGEHIEPSALA